MNHRIFERTLRSLVFRGACLFEYHGILNLQYFFLKGVVRLGLGGFVLVLFYYGVGSSEMY